MGFPVPVTEMKEIVIPVSARKTLSENYFGKNVNWVKVTTK